MGCRPPPYKFTEAGLGITTLYCRELGYPNPAMRTAPLARTLVENIYHKLSFSRYDVTDSIFNLEYSPDGKILGAACAKNCFVLYDSLNHLVTACMPGAHHECCNGITFITNNVFGTFSDDKTVRMWDTRNMKTCTHVLTGHTGWIKNVSKLFDENKVITSSFDNTVRIYDLNQPEPTLDGTHILYVQNLMRMKLAPMTQCMVISVRGGSIYKLAHINWEHIVKDYKQFEMHIVNSTLNGDEVRRPTIDFTKSLLFHKERNKFSFLHYSYEFENDRNCYEMATSLSIHPDEHCLFARHERVDFRKPNEDNSMKVNWSSVYDLRDRPDWERFQLDENSFRISGRDKVLEFPRIINLDEYIPKIVNRSLSKCKTERLKRRSKKYKLAHPPPPPTRIIDGSLAPDPSYDDLYDSSFFVVEYPNNLGMIKENCFHPSGLFMCSPYQNGFRIFTFNKEAQDFPSVADPDLYKYESQPLFEAKSLYEHPGETLCVKCHPWNAQIVSGCYNGILNWYETRF